MAHLLSRMPKGGHTTHGEEGETRVNTSAHMSRAWADPVDDLSASWESDIQQLRTPQDTAIQIRRRRLLLDSAVRDQDLSLGDIITGEGENDGRISSLMIESRIAAGGSTAKGLCASDLANRSRQENGSILDRQDSPELSRIPMQLRLHADAVSHPSPSTPASGKGSPSKRIGDSENASRLRNLFFEKGQDLLHRARLELERIFDDIRRPGRQRTIGHHLNALSKELAEELERSESRSRVRSSILRGGVTRHVRSKSVSPSFLSPRATAVPPPVANSTQSDLDMGTGITQFLPECTTPAELHNALHAIYQWIKLADEQWRQSAEKTKEQLLREQQVAHATGAELEACMSQVRALERQLSHFKAHLSETQGEVSKLRERNSVLQQQLTNSQGEANVKKQMVARLLDAERNLEQEMKRRQEAELMLEAERGHHLHEQSTINEEAKQIQERTQKVLDQVSWQGDACRLQLAAEQLRVQNAEELSNELAQEVSAYKKKLEVMQNELESLQGSTSRLLLHQADLQKNKWESIRINSKRAYLANSVAKWKLVRVQSAQCVQRARYLTALRMQRHRLSRMPTVNILHQDVAAWRLPWVSYAAARTFSIAPSATKSSMPARGMGTRNGAKLLATLCTRLVASAFEVLVDDAKESRRARRRSNEIEKRHKRARFLQVLLVIVGPPGAASWNVLLPLCKAESTFYVGDIKSAPRAFSRTNVAFVSPRVAKKGVHSPFSGASGKRRVDAGDITNAEVFWVFIREFTFWLWYRASKALKTRRLIVLRARRRKRAQLLVLGWEALSKFARVRGLGCASQGSQDALTLLKTFKCWALCLVHQRTVQGRWMHVSGSLAAMIFGKRWSYAQAWKACRRIAQDAAVLRCTRASLRFARDSVLLRLAFCEWRHRAILGILRFGMFQGSRTMRLIASARGIMCGGICIGDGILGRHGMTAFAGNIVSRNRDENLLWMRMIVDQWCAMVRKQHVETRRKVHVRQSHARAMYFSAFLDFDIESKNCTLQCRLLARCQNLVTSQALVGGKSVKRHISCFSASAVYMTPPRSHVTCKEYTAVELFFLSRMMVRWVCIRHRGRVPLVSRRRLLLSHLYEWASWRRVSAHLATHQASRNIWTVGAVFTWWKNCIISDRSRHALLLTVAAMSIRGIRRPNIYGRPKGVGGTLKKEDESPQGRARRFGTVSVALNLLKAEFFALWASQTLDCLRTLPYANLMHEIEHAADGKNIRIATQIVRSRMGSWLLHLQKVRSCAAAMYQESCCLKPQTTAFLGWRHTFWQSKLCARAHHKIAQRRKLKCKMCYFVKLARRFLKKMESKNRMLNFARKREAGWMKRIFSLFCETVQSISIELLQEITRAPSLTESLILWRTVSTLQNGESDDTLPSAKSSDTTTVQRAKSSEAAAWVNLIEGWHWKRQFHRLQLVTCFSSWFHLQTISRERTLVLEQRMNMQRVQEFFTLWHEKQLRLRETRCTVIARWRGESRNHCVFAFHLWYTSTVHRSSHRTKVVNPIARRRIYCRKLDYFCRWLLFQQHYISCLRKIAYALNENESSLLVLAFREWQDLTVLLHREKIRAQRTARKSLFITFCKWNEQVNERCRLWALQMKVARRIMQMCSFKAFRGWIQKATARIRFRCLHNKLVRRARSFCQWKFFSEWEENVSILMHQRRVLKKVIYRMRGFCLSHVLQQWKNVVSKQARHGDVRMKVDSRVKKLCVLQALQTWQERVIWRRFLTAFRLKMVKTIHRRCLMNGFMRWEEAKWLNDDDKRKDKMQKLCRLQDLSRLMARWRIFHMRRVYRQLRLEEKQKDAVLDAATAHLHRVSRDVARKNAAVVTTCKWMNDQCVYLQAKIQDAIADAKHFYEVYSMDVEMRCKTADETVHLVMRDRDALLRKLEEYNGQESSTVRHMLHLLQRINERVRSDSEERDHARNLAHTLALRVGYLESERMRLKTVVEGLSSSYDNLLSNAHKTLDYSSNWKHDDIRDTFVASLALGPSSRSAGASGSKTASNRVFIDDESQIKLKSVSHQGLDEEGAQLSPPFDMPIWTAMSSP